nr:fatty-acid amide hydrolase 2-A-like [Onthophagus taurus]
MVEFGYLLILLAQKILAVLLIPYFWWISKKPKKIIPKIDNPILFYSATKLSEKIRNRELTSEQIIKAYIDRVKVVDIILKAVVQNRFDIALAEAKNVDGYLKSCDLTENELKVKYPLLGVPITVKESCSLQGMSYSVGSKLRRGVVAKSDGIAVKKLREAGAIPILVSNTPELCLFWESNNLIHERTCNPYDTNRTSAGSSGGEGSLLGSGASIIGVGSDVAGSIRLPAMFNGVFGHKPTSRIIPIDGHYPSSINDTLKDFLVIGPMTRYAEDLALMTKIMCDEKLTLNWNEIDTSKLNVYYEYQLEKALFTPKTHKDIERAIQKSVQSLKTYSNATIKHHKFDLSNTNEMCLSIIFDMENIPNVLMESMKPKKSRHLYLEILKSLLFCSDYSLQGLFFYALQHTNVFISKRKCDFYKNKALMLKNDFLEKLGNNGVFLFPTYPTSAVLHNKLFVETSNVVYMLLFNVLGFPSTHVPIGRDSNNLPIGIQVVAAPYRDNLCFSVAKELEKQFGGWSEP